MLDQVSIIRDEFIKHWNSNGSGCMVEVTLIPGDGSPVVDMVFDDVPGLWVDMEDARMEAMDLTE